MPTACRSCGISQERKGYAGCIEKQGKCLHGASCKYAHALGELEVGYVFAQPLHDPQQQMAMATRRELQPPHGQHQPILPEKGLPQDLLLLQHLAMNQAHGKLSHPQQQPDAVHTFQGSLQGGLLPQSHREQQVVHQEMTVRYAYRDLNAWSQAVSRSTASTATGDDCYAFASLSAAAARKAEQNLKTSSPGILQPLSHHPQMLQPLHQQSLSLQGRCELLQVAELLRQQQSHDSEEPRQLQEAPWSLQAEGCGNTEQAVATASPFGSYSLRELQSRLGRVRFTVQMAKTRLACNPPPPMQVFLRTLLLLPRPCTKAALPQRQNAVHSLRKFPGSCDAFLEGGYGGSTRPEPAAAMKNCEQQHGSQEEPDTSDNSGPLLGGLNEVPLQRLATIKSEEEAHDGDSACCRTQQQQLANGKVPLAAQQH
ncbi:zinc finger (ccch type) domain-containing protein [Cyclospora cayetanensis]|uniref:Zinc finger (Ccch type) domain-containing protein n=1 Tax=Cyclospora cayetanensis TaxID=88456 RepID=A0A1D3CZ99_9EIME|nr:zinc finger (ccch type) domain-containing protein [Cyclospora cayetanensis]